MSRLERKKKPYEELGIKGHGGLGDLFDMGFQETFWIDSDEYDYICEHMTNEESEDVFGIDTSFRKGHFVFSEGKRALEVIDKYVKQYRDGEDKDKS